ncbi:nucleoside deaminase [Lysinibacillus louembei]|uniref:Nucleoside deaminase n=1 Tax=Lysinibacillus louembei TaxID=1470088 RepID=A0ABZ0RW28_9BACI|nr:nucleoside deaminase [Lysinibacillus louembei]WPK11028.1 nucleoside deaminase [Lysinibacillus louembei]
MHKQFMAQAIKLAEENAAQGKQPFGAVLVKDGEVVATAVNNVEATLDPTAHAETLAVKEACQKLQTFDLSGMVMYASGEPCPMCLGTMYLTNITEVYYANACHPEGLSASIYAELKLPQAERKLLQIKQL